MCYKNVFKNSDIIKVLIDFLKVLGYDEKDNDNDESNADCFEMLEEAGLSECNLVDKANKPHWLHLKLLECFNDDEIISSPLYKMLEKFPAGSMLKDIAGNYWIRRAKAAITHHRFITVDDQENYYMQKYLINIPVSPSSDVIKHPPSSWIQVAINANIVDQHYDVRANLQDAVKRGFTLENIRGLVQMYFEHSFLDEMEADAFLSTLPCGTENNEEIREVTDQLFGNGEDDKLLPPQSKSLQEYLKKFTDSQKRAFEWISNNIERSKSQILGAIIGAAGCGKSYVMGAMVAYLKQNNLVVAKLAPSGVAASLIKGTTIHNFFKLDITGKSTLENGTVDSCMVKKTDVIITDEFAMIDCQIFLTIEHLCRRFTTKDGRYKPWGGRHVILFGDPAQLPPVSHCDIFNTKLWLKFAILN